MIAAKDGIVWQPQDGPQTALLACPIKMVFFGGARGGGKTDGLLGDFASHAGEHGAKAQGILFRRTLPEFSEIEKRSRAIYGALGWRYFKQDRKWVAPNGATLILRYLFDTDDAQQYQGHNYSWIGVDEAGNYPDPSAIQMMLGTLRSASGIPTFVRMSGNPGGVGHQWLQQWFIDPAPPMTPFKVKVEPEPGMVFEIETVFIPSKLEDNKILMENDPNYEAMLALTGGPQLFRAWRFGDWSAIVGAAFPEIRRDIHVVDWQKVPARHRVIGGGDWGHAKPGWFGVLAIDPEDKVTVVWEFYFNHEREKDDPETVGRKLGNRLRAAVSAGFLPRFPEYAGFDKDSWATGDGRGGAWDSIAELIQKGLDNSLGDSSFPLIPAPKGKNSRKIGKQTFHKMLRYEIDRDGKVAPWAKPSLRFHEHCVHAIRTIFALPVDPGNPEDVDTEAEDHPYDGVQYGLRVMSPSEVQTTRRQENANVHPGFDGRSRRLGEDETRPSPMNHRWNRLPQDAGAGYNETTMDLGWAY